MTEEKFFENTLKILSDKAKELDMLGDEIAMVPAIVSSAGQYVVNWMKDENFKAAFKGNTTAYYLALCANCIGGGMMYADAWADSENRFSDIKYDDLYDGSVWENIFSLAEAKSDDEKTAARKNIMVLFEEWVKNIYGYMEREDAGEYLIKSFEAFFCIGASMRFYIIGY